jgi:hypothetical protein
MFLAIAIIFVMVIIYFNYSKTQSLFAGRGMS